MCPCRDLFEEIDTDSSGGIDADELAAGLHKRGYSVTRQEVDQLIDRMDLNQDGTIAFDEFSSALVDWKKVRECCPPENFQMVYLQPTMHRGSTMLIDGAAL